MIAISDLAAPARIRRALHSPLVPVLGAVFTLDCLAGLVVMGYGNSYLINVLAAPSSYPAYALGFYGVVKLAVAPPGGWLLDRLRPGTVAVLAGSSAASGLAAILVLHSPAGYFAGVGLISLGSSLAWLDVFHVIGGQHESSERGGVMASVGLVSAGATGAGLGMAALVGEAPGWRLAFLLGIGLAAGTTAFLLVVSRRAMVVGRTRSVAESESTRSASRQRLAAALVLFLHFALVSGMLAALAPFALRTLDLSLLQTGTAIAPAGALGALAMLFVGPRSRAATHLRTAAALYVLAGAGLAAMSLTHDAIWFACATVPLGIGIGGATPLINASVLDAARAGERSGVALGYLFFAEGLGGIVGPLLVALLITVGSERTGVVSIAALAVTLAATAGLGSRQAGRRVTGPQTEAGRDR